jgi:hypothetical protein
MVALAVWKGLFDKGDGGSSGGQTANTFDYDSLKD